MPPWNELGRRRIGTVDAELERRQRHEHPWLEPLGGNADGESLRDRFTARSGGCDGEGAIRIYGNERAAVPCDRLSDRLNVVSVVVQPVLPLDVVALFVCEADLDGDLLHHPIGS